MEDPDLQGLLRISNDGQHMEGLEGTMGVKGMPSSRLELQEYRIRTWYRRLRALVLPMEIDTILKYKDTGYAAAERLATGKESLATIFTENGLGYTEDTWPLVIIAYCNKACYAEDVGWHYDFDTYQRRLIINATDRWIRQDVRPFFKSRFHWCGLDQPIHRFEPLRREGAIGPIIGIRTEQGYFDLEAKGAEAGRLLNSIAMRLSHIWMHRDGASQLPLPRWSTGARGYPKWCNPDVEFCRRILADR